MVQSIKKISKKNNNERDCPRFETFEGMEAMEHAQNPVSPEALNRLRKEKKEGVEYYYFFAPTNKLEPIPPTVDRIDLTPRQKGEYIIKIQNGKVVEIRPFGDEILSRERKTYLIERIEGFLKK